VINSEIQIEGYSILHNNRDRHGGGVCTYIINSIAFNTTTRTDLQTPVTDGVESLWIELLLPKTKPIVIGTSYKNSTSCLYTLLSNILDTILNILIGL
jgi:hypothetical protein